MERKKESALIEFMNMIYKSWTWERMTKAEQNRFEENIDFWYSKTVKGSFPQRWEHLQAIYSMFLCGLGYSGPKWRETSAEAIPF